MISETNNKAEEEEKLYKKFLLKYFPINFLSKFDLLPNKY